MWLPGVFLGLVVIAVILWCVLNEISSKGEISTKGKDGPQLKAEQVKDGPQLKAEQVKDGPQLKAEQVKAFQNVSSSEVAASKLMTNFLHIRPKPREDEDRASRQQPPRIEDIVIVMDGSGSIGGCEFGHGKKALQHMMGLANDGSSDANYAAVTFATSATVNFTFLPYSSAADKITEIPYPHGSTNTQAGLTEAKKLFDDPFSGRRDDGRKIVFLVTDGKSDHQEPTIRSAKALKDSGVEIFVVAVGTSINGIDEMVKVASNPPEEFLFRVRSLGQFSEVVKLVIKEVSPEKYTEAL